jgi:hypothetical protein
MFEDPMIKPTEPAPRIRYDPTVNLGHILSFVGFMVAGFTAYGAIEKRVVILEEKQVATGQLAAERVSEQKETLKEIRTDMKEMARGIQDLDRTVRRSVAVSP